MAEQNNHDNELDKSNVDNQTQDKQPDGSAEPVTVDKETSAHAETQPTTKETSADNQDSSAKEKEAPLIHKDERHKKGGLSPSILAIVVFIILLLALGFWLFLQYSQKEGVLSGIHNTQSELEHNMNMVISATNKNTQDIESNISHYNDLSAQVSHIQLALSDTEKAYQNIQKNYQTLDKQRLNWLMNEVEYSLNTIAQQLAFSGDTHQASTALQATLQRLNQFNAPELAPVKQAISQDINTLRQEPSVNIVESSLKLQQLAQESTQLPLLVDATLTAKTAQTAQNKQADEPSNQTWYNKLWNGVKHSLDKVVEVRHINNADALLLAPQQVYFVRQNIKLYLLDARVALNQRQDTIFHSDLAMVIKEVEKYYNTKDANITAWLNQLKELQQINLETPSTQLLQNSLQALHNVQSQNLVVPAKVDEASSAPVEDNQVTTASTPAVKPDQTEQTQGEQ